ncbi:signal peptidase I [Carnobacterium gallinarum]|uniref:signal peptidase I n=1 Tax=Carnobacterium gallinarum TaxID=2749 RepID=UPI00068A11B9|nr:signal peptidase I [Carnobacterium gallinarum]
MMRRNECENVKKKHKKHKIIKGIGLLVPLILFGTGYFLFYSYVISTYNIHIISGSSMENEFKDTDTVLVKAVDSLSRYSVISFAHEDEMYVKRIIGVPGDAVIVNQNRISIDTGGQGKFESVYDFELSETVADELKKIMIIPANSYFVVGDNSDISKDSREFGWVMRNNIEGKIILNFE